MVDKKMYRGNEVDSTPTHKEVDTSDLVYRGVSNNTYYYRLAKARARQGKRELYYRGVAY